MKTKPTIVIKKEHKVLVEGLLCWNSIDQQR